MRSLIINGFADAAIMIRGPGAISNTVMGCYLGLDPSGTLAVSNGFPLVTIDTGARGNTMGGPTSAARNVISAGTYQGLVIRDPGTVNNVVEGNYIGLNATGTAAVSNSWAGVNIFNGAQSNRVGGVLAAIRNVISGNGAQGIAISDPGTDWNQVEGNYVGLNAAGTGAISNGWAGVDIFGGASTNVIGGVVAGAGNVIAGNGSLGVAISQTNTSGNLVVGNHIGVNPAGTLAISNGWPGIQVFGGAQANVIGGTRAGEPNLISGNGNAGVMIDDAGTGNNVVQGNYIGVNATGTYAISNGWAGVYLWGGTTSNLIGGPGAGNLISGNGNQGVVVSDPDTSGNTLAGNLIGLNAAGNAALSNAWAGVALFNQAHSNLIGGVLPGMGNVISGNGNQGVMLADPNTLGNTVARNYIGLDETGTFAVPNGWAGVDLFNSAGSKLIGGGPGARNLISGNGFSGVSLSGGVSGTVIQGNTIGLNGGGSPVPNRSTGVVLYNGAVSSLIGGTTHGTANLIADNLSDGVQLFDPDTPNNTVRGNSIFGNSGIGIALYNSANHLQSAPILVSAVLATSLSVAGALAGTPSTSFHLDFYASPPPPGAAQAKTYLGARDVVTGFGGTVNFAVNLGAIVPIGQIIAASATDPSGNTSQLSVGVAVTAIDSVGDGIPDAWRAAHFGGDGITTNSQSCATCDPDHDGMNNLQEFLAGTDPNNAASVLRISALTHTGTDVTLSFQSATGIVYQVEVRDDVVAGAWLLLLDQLIGTGSTMQITDPGALILPNQFYRLSVTP